MQVRHHDQISFIIPSRSGALLSNWQFAHWSLSSVSGLGFKAPLNNYNLVGYLPSTGFLGSCSLGAQLTSISIATDAF